MKCPDILENLAAYLDGEIDGAPRRAMDSHFADCAACAGERRDARAAWALLDALEAPAAPADFARRVAERARAEGPGAGRILRLPVPLAVAAAALLVGSGALLLLRDGDPATPDATPASLAAAAPPAGLRAQDIALLESLDLLGDESKLSDLELLELLTELSEEDLAVLGG
jgi:anti-sigma factor RsiW